MTQTPEPNPYLGERIVWVICTGQGQETCSNYVPLDPDVPPQADWGAATAAFGEIDDYRVYGKRISPLLIERYLDPDWVEDPDDPDQLPAQVLERIIPTWTHQVLVDTDQRDQIHPAIEIYDGIPEDGAQSVAGLIDGTYYIYPRVFQDAQLCYQPRCASSQPNAGRGSERCLWGDEGFPLEPYFPDCNPPVYPMDAITKWLPSNSPFEIISYTSTWEYYRLDSDPDKTNLLTSTITADMTVYPPPVNWDQLEYFMKTYTYFYNGIYH